MTISSFPLRSARLLCCLLVVAVGVFGSGCSGEKARPSNQSAAYQDVNEELGLDVEASQRERREQTAPIKTRPDLLPLTFESVEVSPDAPKADDSVTVVATLSEGVSQYVDVDLEWRADDRPVRGVSRSVLVLAEHRIVRGTELHVVATATDEHGQTTTMRSAPVTVQNSPPEITSRIDRFHGVHGLTLVAQDIDGDAIKWSVAQGPAGVSINASGRIKVEPVALKEAYVGEVVFLATDPLGARAELHVPVEVTAATPTTREVQTVKKLKTADEMTDEEYTRLNLKAGEAIDGMNAQEVDDYAKKQEADSTQGQQK